MTDDKNQQESSTSSSSSGSNNDSITGNDIPYVPPTDRTNLNENINIETRSIIRPNLTTQNDE
jgi:hypothetical protein